MIIETLAIAVIAVTPFIGLRIFRAKVARLKKYEIEMDKFYQAARQVLKKDLPDEAIAAIAKINKCIEVKANGGLVLRAFLSGVKNQTRPDKKEWVRSIAADPDLMKEMNKVFGHAFLAMLYTGSGLVSIVARRILVKPMRQHILKETSLASNVVERRTFANSDQLPGAEVVC